MASRVVECATCRPGSGRAAFVPVVLALAALAACTPPPSAEQAIDQMLDALGPERARAGVRGLRTIAEGAGPNGRFVMSLTSIRPDTVYYHRQYGQGSIEIWSTPERTWGGSNDEAYGEFAPSARDFVRGHEFHLLLLDMRSRFSNFAVGAEDTVGDESCLRVSMTYESGGPASVCLRHDDWLPVELQFTPQDSDEPLRMTFADWRPTGGINYFYSARLAEGPSDVYSYEYVEISADSFGQAPDLPAPAMPPRPANES